MQSRLLTRIDHADLLAAVIEHYGFVEPEVTEYLSFAVAKVAERWRQLMIDEGMPDTEIQRVGRAFRFAEELIGE
jgi:hypothetical protein